MQPIPFHDLRPIHQALRSEIINAFEEVYDGNWFILGRHVESFEQAYAGFNQQSYCIGTSNGLDALRICLEVLKIGVGDDVVVPANTFIATALAVVQTGARPVFAETDESSFNISQVTLANAMTPQTKAVIPVHLYGHPANMESIMRFCRENSLHVIEDNAQAQGGSYKGISTGSWGDLAATSFYPGKNIGALGDAGAITTNNRSYSEAARILRNYGSISKYQYQQLGYNMRMDECQAAILSVKLKYLTSWIQKRREIAGWYNELLQGVGDLKLPRPDVGACHVYHLYVIRTAEREKFRTYLQSQGVETSIHYPRPLHLETVFSHLNYQPGALPIAEEHARTCVSLPLWVGMSRAHVEFVSEVIKKFFL